MKRPASHKRVVVPGLTHCLPSSVSLMVCPTFPIKSRFSNPSLSRMAEVIANTPRGTWTVQLAQAVRAIPEIRGGDQPPLAGGTEARQDLVGSPPVFYWLVIQLPSHQTRRP